MNKMKSLKQSIVYLAIVLCAFATTTGCLIVVLAAIEAKAANVETNLSQSKREFREKYRLDERGKIQTQGFVAPDLNQTTAKEDRSTAKTNGSAAQPNQSSIDMKLSDLQRIREINLTAFERDDLNVTKLKQDMSDNGRDINERQDKNAEALNLFFRSVEAQRRIDEQTRFILKDESFGAYEYAGEYRDIIDDQLKDANNPVFSGSRLKENNNRYLNPNEQVIVVISSSIPKSTIRAYFQDIDDIEAPFDVKFVLRGVVGSPETLLPTMEYIASIVSKESNRNVSNGNYDNKPFNLKEAVSKAVKEGTDAKTRTDSNETAAHETIDTYKVKIDINPKVTRKYSIDRVPAVIYVKNYNPAIEEPKSLSEAIKANGNPNSTKNADANSNPNLKANANLNATSLNPNDQEEFYVAYGASRLDYSLSKINEKAKSEGLKRLIDTLRSRGLFRDKQSNKERVIPSTEFQSTIKTVVKRRLTGVSITIKRSLIAFQTTFKRRLIALLSAFSVSIVTALTAFKASSIAVVFTRAIAFIAFSVLTFFTPASLNAETYTDLDKAIAATIVRQKPLMIVVMQTTCPYCKQFYEQTLNAEGIMQRLSQEFVIYESYLDKGGVFPTDFEWTGTVPTTYFVAPNGELIGQPLVGVIPLDQFIPYVSQVLEYFYQSKEAALRERYGR